MAYLCAIQLLSLDIFDFSPEIMLLIKLYFMIILQEAMLKEELRNMERKEKREGVDLTYLKNVILKLLETGILFSSVHTSPIVPSFFMVNQPAPGLPHVSLALVISFFNIDELCFPHTSH